MKKKKKAELNKVYDSAKVKKFQVPATDPNFLLSLPGLK